MEKLLIKNIGEILTGDITDPIIAGDSILVENGKISAISTEKDFTKEGIKKIVDAQGMVVVPGLIDTHVHCGFGDFAFRQNIFGWIDSCVHGGTTSMIHVGSGPNHALGKLRGDAIASKALAIYLARSYYPNYRPSGVKVHGGTIILEPGLKESDFAEMAEAGVRVVGEIGLGDVITAEEAVPMVEWAKKYGMVSTLHTGGPSNDGKQLKVEDYFKINPDVLVHLNGGTTAVSWEDCVRLIEETEMITEIVQAGNEKMAIRIVEKMMERNELHRIILGNDHPTGTGMISLGMLRTLCLLCSFSDLKPEIAIGLATGNAAKVYKLEEGFIKPNFPADMVIMDTPGGSVAKDALEAIKIGDIPGVAMVMIDGQIRVTRSRNTAIAMRQCKIEEM